MRIAYITMDDPHDVSGWSGLTYYIGKSLASAGNELEYIFSFTVRAGFILKAKQKIYPKLTGKFIKPNRYRYINDQYTAQIAERLKKVPEPDFLFSNSSELIAAAPGDIPKAFWVDASFAGMIGYYPEFSNIHPATIRNGNKIEQRAYDKASVIFFASDWAAATARDNYRIDDSKIHVVPFGANLDDQLDNSEIIEPAAAKPHEVCKLLFTGVYWDRKGGPLAIEVTKELNKRGIAASLTIIGCTPFKPDEVPEFVIQTGFLDKKSPAGLEKLTAIFKESHFLLVPSKAECYGLVYCEANSYGLPAVATDTGGVPTIIKNGINGKTFSPTAGAGQYADYIERYFKDEQLYKQLAESSLREFKTRLNWQVAGKHVTDILEQYKR